MNLGHAGGHVSRGGRRSNAGGRMDGHVKALPPGAIAFNGWANRLFVVTCAVRAMTVARSALVPQSRPKSLEIPTRDLGDAILCKTHLCKTHVDPPPAGSST
jgi:hypothetical protein